MTVVQLASSVVPSSGDHGVLGAFNVVATASLFLLVAGGVAMAVRSPRLPAELRAPVWLLKVPVALSIVIALCGTTGLVYSYAVLY